MRRQLREHLALRRRETHAARKALHRQRLADAAASQHHEHVRLGLSGLRRHGNKGHGHGAQAFVEGQHAAQTLAYRGLNIERIMPYVLNDHDGFELVRNWTQPKPAFHAYRTLVERLDGAEGVGRVTTLGPGVFAFRYTRGGQQTEVIWAPNGGTATIQSTTDAEVYDLYGKRSVVAQRVPDEMEQPRGV